MNEPCVPKGMRVMDQRVTDARARLLAILRHTPWDPALAWGLGNTYEKDGFIYTKLFARKIGTDHSELELKIPVDLSSEDIVKLVKVSVVMGL